MSPALQANSLPTELSGNLLLRPGENICNASNKEYLQRIFANQKENSGNLSENGEKVCIDSTQQSYVILLTYIVVVV